eukprot:CAMPEP_0178903832 /NCGR_PEP_ID=MMETSP0786-20121207/5367_1 /TAXON_ID=186022 /ORGANISM="Thalassionema frauenfeldii, Strain CCMP 1798" /LENGTH=242 /DNA_ID=CAMNT_0020575229 /DNA_START=634 /DNA_END=1362 /DNA_ORIENTATION=+
MNQNDHDVSMIASAPPEEQVKTETSTIPQAIALDPDDVLEDVNNKTSNGITTTKPDDNALIIASPIQNDSYYHNLLSSDDNEDDDREMASTLFSVLLGSWWFGPVGGIFLGAGTAYTVQQSTVMGDVSRAIGDVALFAGSKMIELNRNHKVLKRSRESLQQILRYLVDFNRRHMVFIKGKRMAVLGLKETLEYARRHQLAEKIRKAMAKTLIGLNWLFKQIDVAPSKKKISMTVTEATPHIY